MFGVLLCLGQILMACAIVDAPVVARIALLAPFEGADREIGYNALYSVRLAIGEIAADDVVLLAVDDGGTVETAVERMRALSTDISIEAAIVLGKHASSLDVQNVSADLPVLVAGYWDGVSERTNVLLFAHMDIPSMLESPEYVGIEATTENYSIFFDIDYMTVLASSARPDDAFRTVYLDSDQFAPEPGIIAAHTYNAATYLLQNIQKTNTRQSLLTAMSSDFVDGFYQNAELHLFSFTESGDLLSLDRVVK